VDTRDPCTICADPRRDEKSLCVVEEVSDLWALDRSRLFPGRFNVLGGKLSALEGVRPEDLSIEQLLRRVSAGGIDEVVLAMNATLEGQTTAHYLAERLDKFPVRLTQLAHGLHWPEARRVAFDTALALDDRLAEIALGAAQPAMAAIKLAWWRDQLAALETQPTPPEPLLGRVVSDLMVAGPTGADCAALAEGWMHVVEEQSNAAPRGQALFALLGKLIEQADVPGGEAFSRADLARRSGDADWLRKLPPSLAPRPVRPITLLDALGRRDAARFWPPEPEATPGRSWTLIRHRLTGR
jgi:hypothetical protein